MAFFISVSHYLVFGHPSMSLDDHTYKEKHMATTVAIKRVREPSNDEYPDLPAICDVTLLQGSVTEAAQLMEAGLGAFFDVHAFNVTIVGDTALSFCTFELINPGKTFTWSLSYPVEMLVQQAQARVFNVIERNMLLARLANGDRRLHPFAHSHKKAKAAGKAPIIRDRNGNAIEIGATCRYLSQATGREGTGWVCDLCDHPLRPVSVRPDDTIGYWAVGMMPSEVELLPLH